MPTLEDAMACKTPSCSLPSNRRRAVSFGPADILNPDVLRSFVDSQRRG